MELSQMEMHRLLPIDFVDQLSPMLVLFLHGQTLFKKQINMQIETFVTSSYQSPIAHQVRKILPCPGVMQDVASEQLPLGQMHIQQCRQNNLQPTSIKEFNNQKVCLFTLLTMSSELAPRLINFDLAHASFTSMVDYSTIIVETT